MTQSDPIRAPSRTCAPFQILVPLPIAAVSATSALGWMRAGRLFMRAPLGVQLYPSSVASRYGGLGQQRPQARQRRGDRATAMRDRVLLRLRQLGRGDAAREQEDRIVAKAAGAVSLGGQGPFDHAAEELDARGAGSAVGAGFGG